MPARSRAERTAALTAVALVAFAANSLLCRLALRQDAIDAATFTAVRFASGAAMLFALAARRRSASTSAGSWTAAAWLTVYAFPFAFAYTQLSAGTGALILFGSVQVTMLGVALASGERPRVVQWLGAACALSGLVFLVLPGLTAPPLGAALLMAVAGIAWAVYSLLGRSAVDPLAQNTANFLRTAPLVCLVGLAFLPRAHADARGLLLSLTSGAITSGLGYVVWYAALRGLSALQAAVVQLAVPLIAAAGGVLLMSEAFTLRLATSTVLVLGGIAVAVVAGRR